MGSVCNDPALQAYDDDQAKWVGIMTAAGFSEHQEFLEFLRIVPDEIARIRRVSADAGAR